MVLITCLLLFACLQAVFFLLVLVIENESLAFNVLFGLIWKGSFCPCTPVMVSYAVCFIHHHVKPQGYSIKCQKMLSMGKVTIVILLRLRALRPLFFRGKRGGVQEGLVDKGATTIRPTYVQGRTKKNPEPPRLRPAPVTHFFIVLVWPSVNAHLDLK